MIQAILLYFIPIAGAGLQPVPSMVSGLQSHTSYLGYTFILRFILAGLYFPWRKRPLVPLLLIAATGTKLSFLAAADPRLYNQLVP
ncbi:hypothetical protein [Pontibacter kalidii]|uniref:hypothetical protein n=1 Tax=Pontibacter kalidii TaxID=2592049 RepID=UPI00224E64D0|nr:hypothetical protein [Pontibacter kalidii]